METSEEELEDISLNELDMIIPPLWTFTKRVKLTKVENPIIIDLGDGFYDDDDYVSLNDIDVFAEPMKVKRKKIKFKKITYQPKIDLGIDLDDL